jgi:predicted nucleic acid-binding protein
LGSALNGPVLLDNSAWVRLGHRRLPIGRDEEIADAVEAGQVFVCLPFLLEAGYSARNGPAHAELLVRLRALPWVEIDDAVEARAIDAQAELARAGHHRLPPPDLILAALADRHDLGILHYDADYDVIGARTALHFESVWLAERGSL